MNFLCLACEENQDTITSVVSVRSKKHRDRSLQSGRFWEGADDSDNPDKPAEIARGSCCLFQAARICKSYVHFTP
eukprot:scaffold5617_cov17-Prasinocladus_malaysianus.AAC.1